MFILYNDQLLRESDWHLPLTDRAFQYNDGFFETAILANGRIRFWDQHRQRMREAAGALHLKLPEYFLQPTLEDKLLQLARQQQAEKYGRLKLKVWRAGAGLYTPQTSQVNWLASIEPATPASQEPLHIGICQNSHTVYTSLSHVKGPNAPLYVLAGLEKQARQQDDMLLLNQQGLVAELISSNIFWVKENTLYTSDLSSGCVNGILRRNILAWCHAQDIKTQQVLQSPEQLLQADAVFAANVTGIRAIASINGTQLHQKDAFVEQLRAGMQV
ncbi:aminotransferase class IV [Pontibacter kalidii]|uniref:aminotransferase class IV n=1 Tax=Pontibacter kalidii TaxID=2592049 RepID=UPI002252EE2B|nr:aminotransferase class IV [Pontibacter kalidii]